MYDILSIYDQNMHHNTVVLNVSSNFTSR